MGKIDVALERRIAARNSQCRKEVKILRILFPNSLRKGDIFHKNAILSSFVEDFILLLSIFRDYGGECGSFCSLRECILVKWTLPVMI